MSRFNNLSGLYTFQKDVVTSGVPLKLSGYQIATTIAFVDSSPDTITDSGSGFLTSGFRVADRVIVSGSTSNDGTYLIDTVVAGTITLDSAVLLTAEAAGSSITLDTLRGVEVPPGIDVVIKAKTANTGTITLGYSSATALNTNTNYESNTRLTANQSVTLQIDNLSRIWMDATVSGEGVEIIFER